MSSHAFKKHLIQVCFIFMLVHISTNFRFQVDFPNSLCYNFPCIEVVLKVFNGEFKTIIWINEWCHKTLLFIIPYFADLSTALFVKKFRFSQVFQWFHPTPNKRATLTQLEKKLCCLNSPFVSLLKTWINAVKGQASLLFSTALYFAFLSVFDFQRRKKG